MKIFLTSLLILVAVVAPTIVAVAPVGAQLDPLQKTCEGISEDDDASSICVASSAPDDPNADGGIVVKTANLLAVVAGIIAVFIMIVAGITMMTSGGDPGKVSKSRNTIIYVAIGLILILLARTIVVFVITRFV